MQKYRNINIHTHRQRLEEKELSNICKILEASKKALYVKKIKGQSCKFP